MIRRLEIGLRFVDSWTCFLVIILCAVSFPGIGRADEIKLTPSVAVKEEYNDNILYGSSETQKDFYTTFSPGLTFLEKTERLQMDLSGRAERRIYSKYSELNATDQFYNGSGQYSLTERLGITGRAEYSQDSRPDRDLETTGLAFTGVTRYRQSYGFGSNYLLSEILLATFSYDYSNDTYNDPRYSDMEAHVFGMGVVHDLNYFMQKTQARTNIKYARYNIPNLRLDNYEWTAGINRALDEKWNLLIDVGLRYTDSSFTYAEFIPIPPFYTNRYENNQDWGAVGQLALTYKGLKNSGDVRINHDIMPASGQSGTTERTSFLFNLTTRLTYEFRCALSGGYFMNKSQAGQYSVQQIDETSIWISPDLIYEYSKDVSFSFSYSYNKTYYHITNTDAERNVFQIRYKIQHDLFH